MPGKASLTIRQPGGPTVRKIRKQQKRKSIRWQPEKGRERSNRMKQQGHRDKTEAAGPEEKPEILLHSCCGPCSTSVIERLVERFRVTVFFYNPNITNEGEYRKRLSTQEQFIREFNRTLPDHQVVRLIEGEYDPERFVQAVQGYEKEPENGERCTICFALRMKKTMETAGIQGYPWFATTLSVSPHKSTAAISRIGTSLQGDPLPQFLDESFKKKDGFRRSVELSKQYHLYRQNYCGCRFSERPGAGPEDASLERG